MKSLFSQGIFGTGKLGKCVACFAWCDGYCKGYCTSYTTEG